MGHFGFSYVGLLYLLMIFTPNIVWTKHKPTDYDKISVNENKVLLLFERIGQMLVTCAALIFSDFNLKPFSSWTLWLIASFVLMLMYEAAWIKYFCGEHTPKSFYGGFCGIPVPLAVLPVAGFLLLGIYGRVIWLIAAVVILGIGHIGIHFQHKAEL